MAEKTGKTRKSAADKIISLPIGEIRPYEKNPRKNAKAVKYVHFVHKACCLHRRHTLGKRLLNEQLSARAVKILARYANDQIITKRFGGAQKIFVAEMK